MLDFDPRDYDSRDDERHSHTPSRGGRGSSGDNERDHDWRQPDTRMRDRDVPGYRDHAVSLTKDGRSLLESHRGPDHEHFQTFYAGLGRERELEHDLQVYRAYEQAEDRLLDLGAHIERVALDHELKSEYQALAPRAGQGPRRLRRPSGSHA